MSNLWLNIRFGNYHLQIGEPHKYSVRISFNSTHINNKKRFEIYDLPFFK